MLIWTVFQLAITIYITFFVPEVDPAVEAENQRLKEEKKLQKAIEKQNEGTITRRMSMRSPKTNPLT